MKKESNKLKENLVNSDFSVKGECAISLILTKLDIINIELSMILDRNVIQMKTGRMKSYESTCKKMKKKGLEKNFSNALEKINDLIGVRAICSYVDDIYRIAEILSEQKDVKIVKVKDYIKDPKSSGYRLSLIHISRKAGVDGALALWGAHFPEQIHAVHKIANIMDIKSLFI